MHEVTAAYATDKTRTEEQTDAVFSSKEVTAPYAIGATLMLHLATAVNELRMCG